MEDTLREQLTLIAQVAIRLNPCFNGRYSQRSNTSSQKAHVTQVLILVLMEDTLRVLNQLYEAYL